jgi:hypothetical protein
MSCGPRNPSALFASLLKIMPRPLVARIKAVAPEITFLRASVPPTMPEL